MFSMTTMASSTTMPVASTMAKSVKVLIENPSRWTKANAPMSETGSVSAGMSVARQLCRNRNITRTTSRIASPSVLITSRIDSSTTVVVSNAMRYSSPAGNDLASLAISAATPAFTSSALAVGRAITPKPSASTAWNRSSDEYVSAPSSARPTSLRRTRVPSVPALTMMFSNSPASRSLPAARTLI